MSYVIVAIASGCFCLLVSCVLSSGRDEKQLRINKTLKDENLLLEEENERLYKKLYSK